MGSQRPSRQDAQVSKAKEPDCYNLRKEAGPTSQRTNKSTYKSGYNNNASRQVERKTFKTNLNYFRAFESLLKANVSTAGKHQQQAKDAKLVPCIQAGSLNYLRQRGWNISDIFRTSPNTFLDSAGYLFFSYKYQRVRVTMETKEHDIMTVADR